MTEAKKPGECCSDCARGLAADVKAMQSPSQIVFDAEIPFNIEGRAGEVIRREIESVYSFRILRKLSTDTSKHPGSGSLVRAFTIANKRQAPANVSTALFSDGALECGVRFDTCKPGEKIALEVEFLTDCIFHAVFLGKAVKDGGAP